MNRRTALAALTAPVVAPLLPVPSPEAVVTDSQFQHTPAFQAVAWAILRKQPLPNVAEIQRVARQGAQ